MKLIWTGPQIGVHGLAPWARLVPATIEPVQLISKSNTLRNGQTQPCQAESNPLMSGWNTKRAPQIEVPAVCRNSLNLYQSRRWVAHQASGLDYRQAAIGRKPDAAQRVFDYG